MAENGTSKQTEGGQNEGYKRCWRDADDSGS